MTCGRGGQLISPLGELRAAVAPLGHADEIKNRAVAEQFKKVAHGAIGQHVAELQKAVGG
jgi:hypothetical protein